MYNDLNVRNENLYVHCTKDINNLNVQNENLHVHNTDDIDNLNVHNNYLQVHSGKHYHNFTCSEYKARDHCAKEIQPSHPLLKLMSPSNVHVCQPSAC